MSEEARSVTVRVPAKVNLQLSVGPRRGDGYHEIVTVFHSIGIFDEVTASCNAPSAGVRVTADGQYVRGMPLDDSNLAFRAAHALADYADVVPDVQLHVHKRIPVAAGLAGGSADAAAALVACDALWGTGLGREEMDVLAGRLGSDVTFSLHGWTAIGTGRGEQLTSALIGGQFHWVCAFVDRGLRTSDVYSEFDRLRGGRVNPASPVSEALMVALRRGDAREVGRNLTNDLQPAAISLLPKLDLLLEAGREAGALGGIVSGSGPTCAFLARDSDHALDIAAVLCGSGQCDGVAQAMGPVSGVRVVESRSGTEGDAATGIHGR